MISKQTWKPDTCECVIEETHNPEDPTYGVKFSKVISKCQVHASVSDDELFGVIYENPDGENKRKNQVLRVLLGYENVKGLGLEEMKKNPDGKDAGLGLKEGIEYDWAFEGEGKDRVLKVEVKGANLSLGQKNAIRGLSNTKFGVGKVEVI